LRRFMRGGGTLYDLEYLLDVNGRRVAAFGYWAGFAGAAVGIQTWIAQQAGDRIGPQSVESYPGKNALTKELRADLEIALNSALDVPDVILIGASGRVGSGAGDLCDEMGLKITRWDTAETASGGPFPEILDHAIFINCVLAGPSIPMFVPKTAVDEPRRLCVISDVSCDPSSDYNPIPLYTKPTSFAAPVVRVARDPVLDITAIDNLPSMLPVESSQDFAAQLLPSLLALGDIDQGVWGGAKAVFQAHATQKQGQ